VKRWAAIGALLCALVLVPSAAIAAGSIDASPVVTVAGSVCSVTGTVSLSAASVAEVGVTVASAIPTGATVATVTLDPLYDGVRDEYAVLGLVAAFWMAAMAGFLVVKG
jgi:hypothetical protein